MVETTTMRHHGYRYQCRFVPGERQTGDPLVLIGGAFQTMRSLEKFAEVFRRRRDVVLIDLPGSGDSDLPPPSVGGDVLADCLVAVLDRWRIGRAQLGGVSFGSAIAYTVARRYPERFSRLVLVGTMSHVDERMVTALRESLAALDGGDRNRFADRVSQVLLCHERRDDIVGFQRAERLLRASVGRMTAREMEQFRVNALRLLMHRRLDTDGLLPVPTLALTGEYDTVTTPARCREVAATSTDAHWAVVHRADHLVPLERFDVCAELVETYLSGVDLASCRGCDVCAEKTRWDRSRRRPRAPFPSRSAVA